MATDPKPASPPEHIVSEEETLALERARKEQEEREAAERARKKKEAEAIAKANQFGNLCYQRRNFVRYCKWWYIHIFFVSTYKDTNK